MNVSSLLGYCTYSPFPILYLVPTEAKPVETLQIQVSMYLR